MCGTLRHFIAKMTFFNACNKTLVTMLCNRGNAIGGHPHNRIVTSITFTCAFRYTGTTHTLTQGAVHYTIYPAQHPSGIGARGSYPKVTYMSLVLDAAQLSRVFGKGENAFTAVDRVSLRVSSGEIHALLGPNGAGKTTTVQMCSTLLTPTGGSLTVNGIDAIAHPQRARRHVGLALGGENGFYPRASARDNLLFFADVAGVSGPARGHEVEHALARVELTDAATRPVQEFSRGMKQRLHIARALLGSPALLLLDEPTNGLDPDIALTVRTLIRSLAEDGAAVLLTSHLLGEIEDLAHTITVLGAGSVAVSGSLEDVAAHAGIAATTVVQVEPTATEGIDTLRGFLGEKAAVLFAPRGSGWELTLYWHGERATFEAGEAHRILTEGLAAARIGARTEPYTRPATLEEAYLAMAEGLKR